MKTMFIKFFIGVLILLTEQVLAESFLPDLDYDPYGIRKQIQTMDEGNMGTSQPERRNHMHQQGQTHREAQFGTMGASGITNIESLNQDSGSRRHDGSGSRKYRTSQSAQDDNSSYRYGQNSGSDSSTGFRSGSGQGRGNRYGMGSR